jgi:uncharacterized membrane protein
MKMKWVWYGAVLCLLVPVQATVLRAVSIGEVRPNLCLVTVCLIGLVGGESEGLLMGLLVGGAADLFSAGEFWPNLLLYGFAGVAAGLTGRHVTNAGLKTFVILVAAVSLVTGMTMLGLVRAGGFLWRDVWGTARLVLAPELILNTAAAAALYAGIGSRLRTAAADDAESAGGTTVT